jgi:hypothetical protein
MVEHDEQRAMHLRCALDLDGDIDQAQQAARPIGNMLGALLGAGAAKAGGNRPHAVQHVADATQEIQSS